MCQTSGGLPHGVLCALTSGTLLFVELHKEVQFINMKVAGRRLLVSTRSNLSVAVCSIFRSERIMTLTARGLACPGAAGSNLPSAFALFFFVTLS